MQNRLQRYLLVKEWINEASPKPTDQLQSEERILQPLIYCYKKKKYELNWLYFTEKKKWSNFSPCVSNS